MDAKNPYERKEGAKKEKPTKKRAPVEDEFSDLYLDPDADKWDGDDGDDDNEEDEGSLDGDDDEFEDDVPWYTQPKYIVILAVGIIVAILAIYFIFIKKDAPQPIVEGEEVEEIDQTQANRSELYRKGIGKDAIDEKNIYEQGSIESSDFRRDFVNTDSPENYALPINITAVNDSVSYTKHRTMTDDGMDMYWVDAVYKSKKTRFTVPYYIWQTLAPQGVMDVIAEVVTDAEDRTFVTSITAVPPSGEDD